MKRSLYFLLLFVYAFSISAQQKKGVQVNYKGDNKNNSGKTYALICGISKYKNPSIPQLQFADRDAIAFRNYLLANEVDSNNIMLLLNERATNGEFWASINYLTEIAKQGDIVFIYFSGHGDVENKTVVKDAYLLPYDAPRCVYPAGAIAVPLLKSWIATLSANGIQAVFIADACRSGNLAGGKEGMTAAAQMLRDKWQDEIKILSCQPGEISLEGTQWGNGRGLFSFELINGLSGLADKNKDGNVTLRELNLYITEKVPEEANPVQQNPIIAGQMESLISKSNEKLMGELKMQSDLKLLASVEVKGFDGELIKSPRDSVKINYKLFNLYLDSGIYAAPENQYSAYYFYKRIPQTEQTKQLVSVMKKNLSSSVMSKMDKAIDLIINNKLEESGGMDNESLTFNEIFHIAEYDVPALRSLLDYNKLKSTGFLSKAMFFSSLSTTFGWKNSVVDEIMDMKTIDSAITIDPTSSYLYLIRGNLYKNSSKFKNLYKALADEKNAVSISPRCVYPLMLVAEVYCAMDQHDSAIISYQSMYDINLDILKQSNHRSKSFIASNTITFEALQGIATEHTHLGNKKEAFNYVDKMIMLNNSEEDTVRQASNNYVIGNLLYHRMQDYEKAIIYYKHALNASHQKARINFYVSCCYAMLDDKTNSLMYLDNSLKAGFKDFGTIDGTDQFDKIKAVKEFKTLVDSYRK